MTPGADVIIIGSGPAGVSAAWPLVEAGVRVLMLDASDGTAPPTPPGQTSMEAWRRHPDRWQHELGSDGPLVSAERSPKFETPQSQAALAGFAEATSLVTRNFFAVGSLAAGGLSRMWGALATEYEADDLAPWGEQRDEMIASYSRIRARIGTGPAPLFTPPIERMMRRHEASGDTAFKLTRASNAVVSETRAGREGCNRCGVCLYGCGRGSIYHSAQELDALRGFRNFSYRSGMQVIRVSDAGGYHVAEARNGRDICRFSASALVMAAGTLMTTKLVLKRLGLFGRAVRLESNPVGGTAFLVPGLVGSALPQHSFALGQLFYTLFPEAGVEMAGVFYGADTLPLATIADRLPFTRPTAMRIARALMPALVMATGYLPGRFSDNSLTLEDDGADGRLIIHGRHAPRTEVLLNRGFHLLGKQVRRLGGWRLPFATQRLEPGSDAHTGATLAMGGKGPAATDEMGRVVGLGGLYVADGASLPRLSARHPTLTIMANADRIGRALARRIVSKPEVTARG